MRCRLFFFFFSSRRRHTRLQGDWSSDVCSSDLALDPSIKIVAPWREWAFKGRDDLLAFAREHQIPIAKDKEGEAPFSVDANLLHSSSEGKVLEDPSKEAPPVVYQRTVSPMEAPDQAAEV